MVSYIAQAYNTAAAFRHGGAQQGLLAAFTPTVSTSNPIVNIIGNAAIAGAQSKLGGGTFRDGAKRSLATAAVMFAISAIGNGVRSPQTGNKFAGAADSNSFLSNFSGQRRGDNAQRLERNMTQIEQAEFKAQFAAALAENRIALFAAKFVSNVLDDPMAEDYAQALSAISAADIFFRLDSYGPSGDEMRMDTEFVRQGSSWAVSSAELRIYKGAYEAYLYGSVAAEGYEFDIPRGYEGLVAMIAHESGHGVFSRNVGPDLRQYPDMESRADRWIHVVWPGRY